MGLHYKKIKSFSPFPLERRSSIRSLREHLARSAKLRGGPGWKIRVGHDLVSTPTEASIPPTNPGPDANSSRGIKQQWKENKNKMPPTHGRARSALRAPRLVVRAFHLRILLGDRNLSLAYRLPCVHSCTTHASIHAHAVWLERRHHGRDRVLTILFSRLTRRS